MILSNLDEYTKALLEAVIRGTRLLHADKTLEIYSIENRRAAIFWLTDSRWCVRDNPWFEGYLEQGPLLLLRSHQRKRDYLLAPASGEFRNRNNRAVSLSQFASEHRGSYLPLMRLGVCWNGAPPPNVRDLNVGFRPTPYAQIIWGDKYGRASHI